MDIGIPGCLLSVMEEVETGEGKGISDINKTKDFLAEALRSSFYR